MRKLFTMAMVHIKLKDGTTDSGTVLASASHAVKIQRDKKDSQGTRYPTYFKEEVDSIHLGKPDGEQLHFPE